MLILETSMNKLLSRTMVCFCFAAMTASMANAQTTPNANGPSASPPSMRFEHRPFTRPTERIEARLAYIKTALKITDAQQSQWDGYASFVRKNAQDLEQGFQVLRIFTNEAGVTIPLRLLSISNLQCRLYVSQSGFNTFSRASERTMFESH